MRGGLHQKRDDIYQRHLVLMSLQNVGRLEEDLVELLLHAEREAGRLAEDRAFENAQRAGQDGGVRG